MIHVFLRIRISLLILVSSVIAVAALPSRSIVTRRSLFRPQQRKTRQGTHLSIRKPTREACSEWFHDDWFLFSATTKTTDNNNNNNNNNNNCFNHKTAGMTNPSLHIAVDNTVVMQISAKSTPCMKSSSTSVDSNQLSTSTTTIGSRRRWWPDLTSFTTDPHWRICQYQRYVGQGRACYEAVRDQVLSWEFDTPNLGIVAVEHTPRRRQRGHARSSERIPRQETSPRGGFDIVHTGTSEEDDTNPCSWRSTASALRVGGDARRLATYSRCLPFVGWGSNARMSLWCSNPVQIVYELVDQRGPSTTYTSSAYATMKGHWLAGEERLTVALRDEDGQVHVQLVSYSKPKSWIAILTWPMVQRMQERFFDTQMNFIQDVATSAVAAQPQDEHRWTLPLINKQHLPLSSGMS